MKGLLIVALFFALASCQDLDYGVMIDAGSSGSRIYLYQWPHRGINSLPLVEPTTINQTVVSKKINLPLSSYDSNPSNAGASLTTLIDYVKANLPQSEWAVTPIYLKATAGMRALNQSAQDQIIANVRVFLKTTPFLFQDDYAKVIPGTDEGVFGWITTNYAKQLLTTTSPTTFGALDMGGASTQITFDPEGNPTSNLFNMTLGINIFPLYTYSYPLGQDQALRLILAGLLADNAVDGNGNILNPCFLKSYNETYQNGPKLVIGTGDYTTCQATIQKYVVTSTTPCASTCGMNGVYQPPVSGTFYAFSGFAYTNAFFGLPANASISLLAQTATQYCGTDLSQAIIDHPKELVIYIRIYCFTTAYFVEVLRAYGFTDDSHQIVTQVSIGDIELTWALGGMIYEANLLPFGGNSTLGTTSTGAAATTTTTGSATTSGSTTGSSTPKPTSSSTTGSKTSDATYVVSSIFVAAIMIVSLLM